VTTPLGFVSSLNVNEVIKPTNNTGVSLYVKLSPQNVSFYRPKLLNGLTPCEPPFIVCSTSSLKQNSTAYTPVLTVGFEPTFSTYRYRYRWYKHPLVRQHIVAPLWNRTTFMRLMRPPQIPTCPLAIFAD
jgi:hypothetical protein